jgi:hypothetical protein
MLSIKVSRRAILLHAASAALPLPEFYRRVERHIPPFEWPVLADDYAQASQQSHPIALEKTVETRSIKAPSPRAAHRSPPSQSEAPGRTPASDVDPFAIEFFEDPFPVHESLREAGPVVWLSRYGVWAVARYQEVHAVLNDWRTFCSGRGVGMADFAKEKPWRPPSLVLETDPPEHDRARAVLNRVLSPALLASAGSRFQA